MSSNDLAVADDDPLMDSDCIKEVVIQMRAAGSPERLTAAWILDQFILTKERRKALPVVADPDGPTVTRLTAFYNAIAALIEKECRLTPSPIVNLTHDGFGRVVITVGKLVVFDKTLRDARLFGFESLKKMKDEVDKHLSVALQLIGKHPEVAQM